MSEFEEKLRKIVNEGELWVNEPMSAHTTFRIGGPADFLVTPGTAGQLKEILALCREENQPFFILGNGSNLLVGDRGYSGTMICLSRLSAVETEETCIRAQAGALLSKIAREACERSLAGFEFAAGIPGSLGGAVVMNAGAYGGELKDVLVNVTVMDREGNILKKTPEELCMGYRTSSVLSEEYVVLEAEINLEKGDRRRQTAGHAAPGIPQRRKHLHAAGGVVCRKAHRRRGSSRVPGGRRPGGGEALRLRDQPGTGHRRRRHGALPPGERRREGTVRRGA